MRSVDGKHLMGFQSKTTVFKFLRVCVEKALGSDDKDAYFLNCIVNFKYSSIYFNLFNSLSYA